MNEFHAFVANKKKFVEKMQKLSNFLAKVSNSKEKLYSKISISSKKRQQWLQ